MKMTTIHLIKPSLEKPYPIEIDQKQKVKLWGEIARTCLCKEIQTDVDFFACVDNEAKRHLKAL